MVLAINKLLELGAIEKCNPCNDQFISRIFLATKPNGDKRFILNLKPLNKFISTTHFKMEDYRTACKLIPENGYIGNIDLKEAYLLVPVAKEYQKYLRFEFPYKNTHTFSYFQFTVMPYGLSIAPRVFSKIMKEAIAHLRCRGFKSVIYLDDILCIGEDYKSCSTNIAETLRLVESLGFVVNYTKSFLEPTQVCKFLGFVFNTTNMSLSLPLEKRQSIEYLLNKFKLQCSVRDLAQLIGTLTAACPASKYSWIYTKTLERQKYLALQGTQDYDTAIDLPDSVLRDINWWLQNIHTTSNYMRPPPYKLEIFSDASLTGWGAVCNNNRAHGGWKYDERKFHINYLELLAVFLALKTYAENESNCSILLRVDNTTAIAYINRMGGIQFPHLNDLARSIWQWCEERNIWLFASYINTKENREADEESRKLNTTTEWALSDKAYNQIIKTFGQPEVDLFASRTTAKCKNYVAWKQDPEAIAIDAFTIKWTTGFYAFPPFCLLLKAIRKIIQDKACGILVFPSWPSQPWFPLLKDILATDMLIFHPDKKLLLSQYRLIHPLHRQLTLAAARVCARPSCKREHQKRL